MTDRSGNSASSLQELFTKMVSGVERLESALDQMVNALKKRGIQPSVDVSSMARDLRRDIDAANRLAQREATIVPQLQELVRTMGLINSSLDLDKVLEDVMDTIIKLTKAERAYLMLREGTSADPASDLTLKIGRNWDRESLQERDAVFSSTITRSAIEQRQPILTTNAQDDARFQGMESVVSNALRSIVCIPLIIRGQVIGVLYADNRIGQGVFNPENLPLLGAFANQAAVAIENARLFSQVKADLHKAEKEVKELRIIIDEGKKSMQVEEITNTEYFQQLESRVRDLRRRSAARSDT